MQSATAELAALMERAKHLLGGQTDGSARSGATWHAFHSLASSPTTTARDTVRQDQLQPVHEDEEVRRSGDCTCFAFASSLRATCVLCWLASTVACWWLVSFAAIALSGVRAARSCSGAVHEHAAKRGKCSNAVVYLYTVLRSGAACS